MIEIEISSIFHEVFLIISYVTGVISAIIVGRKNNIQPIITTLIILISTIFYLFFINFIVTHSGNWYLVLASGFPHIEKSFGLAGVIFGLILSGLLLRIPLSILYKFSFPILIIYGVSNLGCLGGHCNEVHTGLFHGRDYLNFLASFSIGNFLNKELLADASCLAILFKILAGGISATSLFFFLKKFKNPRNIFLMVFSSIFLISFISQFLIHPTTSHPVFNRLLGLNIFQWAMLMILSLMMLKVLIDELLRDRRKPKLRIKSTSTYKIFILYTIILYVAFHDASYIINTNPSIFIMGFSFTTILMVLYFHQRIRNSAIRYATILIILTAGSLFLQTSFFSPGNQNQDIINRSPERRLDNQNVKREQDPFHTILVNNERPQFVKPSYMKHESLILSPLNSMSDVFSMEYSKNSSAKEEIGVMGK